MLYISFFFFFNDTATTEIYTLSLHDALPICFLFPPGGGEVNRERRSLPRRRVHQHQATVRIHGALHDGEAEAGAADSTRDERLEQAGPQGLRGGRAVCAPRP